MAPQTPQLASAPLTPRHCQTAGHPPCQRGGGEGTADTWVAPSAGRFDDGAGSSHRAHILRRTALVAVACPSARTYSRRIPEATVLYRVVQQYFGEFLAQVEAADRGGRLPAFVKEEFEAYLGCGLLSRGCLHVRCEQCGDEMVVAFSCKGRFCPSCGGRRMTELAAHLVDRVIPDVPVRQWVLSLPWSCGTSSPSTPPCAATCWRSSSGSCSAGCGEGQRAEGSVTVNAVWSPSSSASEVR